MNPKIGVPLSLFHEAFILVIIFFVLMAPMPGRSQPVQSPDKNAQVASASEEQLNKFLVDRPQVQSIVKKGNPIWNWLRTAFENTKGGMEILWDNQSTSDFNPFGAESHFFRDTNIVYVRVDRCYKTGEFKGIEREPEEILVGIVFELMNVNNRSLCIEQNQLAETKRISKRDYVLSLAKSEYVTSKAVLKFYRETWVPFCQRQHIEYEPALWSFAQSNSFDSWLASFPADSGYPWRSYGKEYDQLSAPKK
jgi:hypothetical protein